MSTVSINDAPQNLSMQNFRSVSDDKDGLAKSCRFVVVIRPVGTFLSQSTGASAMTRDLMYLCETAELPGRGLLSLDLRYYGPNFKLPIQSQYEDINMTFLCRTKSLERQFFDDWMADINPPNTFDFNYRGDYEAEIDIYQYGEAPIIGDDNSLSGEDSLQDRATAPEAHYQMTLRHAYPILVNPQPLAWSDNGFQKVIISFTYAYWIRRGLDSTNRGRDGNIATTSFDLVTGRTVPMVGRTRI